MKEYIKPRLEEELIEVEDVIATSGAANDSLITPQPGDNIKPFPGL